MTTNCNPGKAPLSTTCFTPTKDASSQKSKNPLADYPPDSDEFIHSSNH
jgi:hypothetical protein